MTDLTLQELSDIVAKIQDEINYQTNDSEPYFICINTNGFEIMIDFLDIQIWNSEDDPREYDENDDYEPMDGYLRREIITIIQKLSRIKL